MKESNIEKYKHAGRQAYFANYDINDCPYEEGTEEYLYCQEGWCDADEADNSNED